MNGVMPNPQYMPSPHGLAKRIRLHHNTALYLENSQGNDQHGSFNGDINNEQFKTSHIYTGDTKFTNQCLNFDLASSDEKCFDSVFSLTNENPRTAVVSAEIGMKPGLVTNGSDSRAFKRMHDDASVQTVKNSEGYFQTDTNTESVESSFDDNYCSSVGYKTRTIDVASTKIKPECDKESKVRGSLTSSGSQCKTKEVSAAKHEPKSNIGKEAADGSSLDFVQRSHSKITNGTSIKRKRSHDTVSSLYFVPRLYRKSPNASSVKRKINHDVELNYNASTSDLVSRFQCKKQLNEKSTEVVLEPQKLKDDPNLLRPSVIVQNKLFNCKPYLREDEIEELEYITSECVEISESEDNLSHKKSSYRRKRTNFKSGISENVKTGKITPKTKSVVVENLNSNSRIPRQTYAKIMKRLPPYKQFSNVFQKAKWNATLHKNHHRIYSPVDTTKVTSSIIDTYKLKAKKDKITLKKWQFDVLQDMGELDDFLDYVSGKISELCLAIRSINKDMQMLEVESEDVSVPLHYIQNAHFSDENNLITSTRSEMLELGGYLLKRIDSVRQNWKDILITYRHHLVIVSRSLYKLCSIPIETKVIDDRKTVYGFVDKMDKLIETIEVTEKILEDRRDSNFKELLELQKPLKKFHKLDSLLDELC